MCNKSLIPTCETNAESMLICPICQGEMIHPMAVECHSPGTANGYVRINNQGIHLAPTCPPVGRGVMITLKFSCEYGHTFEYEMHFHKGSTFVKRQMYVLPTNSIQSPNTIWRD